MSVMPTDKQKSIEPTIENVLMLMYENELDLVTATFSGSGDSGTINNATGIDIDGEMVEVEALAAVLLPQYVPKNIDDFGSWRTGRWIARDFKRQPLNLSEFIDSTLATLLEHSHGGWEINAGSSGTITVKVARNRDGSLRRTTESQSLKIEIEYGYDDDEDDA